LKIENGVDVVEKYQSQKYIARHGLYFGDWYNLEISSSSFIPDCRSLVRFFTLS
jgi:hypothetical protein